MSKNISWVHLSDFHFGQDEYGGRQFAESILDHIKRRKSGLPELFFLTGDIAFSGDEDQYKKFNEQFYGPLINLLGDSYVYRIFIVPGNHDLNRKTNELIARSTLREKRAHFFDPTANGLEERKEIIERFQAFNYADCNLVRDGWVEKEGGVFVQPLELFGVKVGLLGLNTAWHCQDSEDCGQISPGANLVQHGLKLISDCALRIVLGHHPVEWFLPNERTSIERLFQEHRIIYLHGHMHKNNAAWKGWPNKSFLTVQAGAAFQAREDNDKWQNRILYGEADLLNGKIWVEPFTWSRKEGWVPEGGDIFPSDFYESGRWGLPLPHHVKESTRNENSIQPILLPKAPEGWQLLDTEFLMRQRQTPSRTTVLAYYDGHIPSWPLALSPDVPKRAVVTKLVNEFITQQANGKAAIRLLSGAGGEGKSTAAMQIAAELVENGWQVLWRRSDVKGISGDYVQILTDTTGPWVIATDDADLIAENLYENAHNGLPSIHFLLVARDTDWANNARRWGLLSGYRAEEMNGLDSEDAHLIVDAWARHGEDGLGGLANIPLEDAARRLVAASQDQYTRYKHDGAFLGAMLQLRKGAELRNHVASVLERLGSREINQHHESEGKTLLDALAYIAAMHAENLLFLSKPVLAKVLGCRPNKLKRDVLRPLGEEAAADSSGGFILTRHRAIAEATIEFLQLSFDYDVEELYVELARAARQVFLDADPAFGPVAEIQRWNFISDHFFDQGKKELGIRLAMNLVDVEPTNLFFLSKLAHLYRKYEQPEKATNLFRNLVTIKEGSRPFYHEWATCEGADGNLAINVWMDGLSLSDQAERKILGTDSAPVSMQGISRACRSLCIRYPNEVIYSKASSAAMHLALVLTPKNEKSSNDIKSQNVPQRISTNETIQDYLNLCRQAIERAWEQREVNVPNWVPDQSQLEFSQLANLLGVNLK